MEFQEFKSLIQDKVFLESQSKKDAASKEKLKEITQTLLRECKKHYSMYFSLDADYFSEKFENLFTSREKVDDFYFFRKNRIKSKLQDFCLFIKKGNKTYSYLLSTSLYPDSIRLPLYNPIANIDDYDGPDFITEWGKLLKDFPSAYNTLWEIAEDNMAHKKDKQLSLVRQLIERNKKEIEMLKNKEEIEKRIKSLENENTLSLKKIDNIKQGTFDIDL